MAKTTKNFCQDCGTPSYYHIETWIDEFTNRLLPNIKLPRKLEQFFDVLIEKFFTFSRIACLRDDFTSSDIQLRSTCFINELKKRGATVRALRGPAGYTNHFRAEINHKIVRFEGLPTAEFISKHDTRLIDDKARTKSRLQKGKFPTAQGQSFWFWQKKKGIRFGIKNLGFPLVVKPRSGSISRHVTTNIQNLEKLKKAINKAIIYSPAFIVERFIANTDVYRATVIDFDFVACVKQMPANVTGDGVSTIHELIKKKNDRPDRGYPDQKEYTLYKIAENATTTKLLNERGYNFLSIPKKNEVIFLQKDPFLKLGGDLAEVTPQVHQDNLNLFRQIAKLFDTRVVGIDFLTQDISRSYKKQQCAILELNSLPCIELHHFPSSGAPQNVAKALADLFFKYY